MSDKNIGLPIALRQPGPNGVWGWACPSCGAAGSGFMFTEPRLADGTSVRTELASLAGGANADTIERLCDESDLVRQASPGLQVWFGTAMARVVAARTSNGDTAARATVAAEIERVENEIAGFERLCLVYLQTLAGGS